MEVIELFVVKIGGGKGIDLENVLDDLVTHRDFILVHGGSDETNRLQEALGHPPRFVTSPSGHTSRYTDRETLHIFEMAYAGKINVSIVESLQKRGVNALGLTGVDGRLLEGVRKSSVRIVENGKTKVLHGDHTGRVERVNIRLLKLILGEGYLPVITVPAISYEGDAINVDGDRAASQIARALEAETLLILSNVPGLLRDVNDQGSLVPSVPRHDIDLAMETLAVGRMKKKLLGAKEALDGGVRRVIIASANADKPVTSALQGQGTVFE